MIDDKYVHEFRKNRLTPDNPFIRGTAQNPDVFFQGRETVNKFYDACPEGYEGDFIPKLFCSGPITIDMTRNFCKKENNSN